MSTTTQPPTFRRLSGAITKVDTDLGLVFGWLMVCQKRDDDGDLVDYFDKQGDHIPHEQMIAKAADFMIDSRATKAMHSGSINGTAVFAFPMTPEIAKAYGIEVGDRTGLMFAAKPDAESLERFRSGDYAGFSIGGAYIDRQEVTD